MDSREPRIHPASRRGRKLIDATFRVIARWRPVNEWGTIVVQPDCSVRIGRLGDVSGRAPADQRTADGPREPTIPPRAARSAPSRRIVQQNRRAALHQAALKFCCNRLLKLAFRGFRMHSAFGSTSASADEASRRASSPSPAPTQEMMQTDDDFAITVSSSSEKRTVSVRDGESSQDRSHSPPSHRARRDAAGSEAAQSLSGTSTMGGPSTDVFVPPPPPLPSPPILSPLPSHDLPAAMARSELMLARLQAQMGAMKYAAPPLPLGAAANPPLPLGAVACPESAPLPPVEKPHSG